MKILTLSLKNSIIHKMINKYFNVEILYKDLPLLVYEENLEQALLWCQNLSQDENCQHIFASASFDKNDEENLQLSYDIRKKYSHIVIIGMGGSSLNAQNILSLNKHSLNNINLNNINEPQFHVIDNCDQEYVRSICNQITLEKSLFIFVSKSGETLEVIVILATILELLAKNNLQPSKHLMAICELTSNSLHDIARELNLKILPHSPYVGGRFSSFCNIATLPAAISGIDIKAFKKGASEYLNQDFDLNNEAVRGAALNFLLSKYGFKTNVMMPYCQRLDMFALWYRQIWAESIGKNEHATTPIVARGSQDQHSQLQLYIDGGNDKLFNFINVANQTHSSTIKQQYLPTKFQYLADKSLPEVNKALMQGTVQSLSNNNRPLRIFTLQQLNESSLGALMMHFILETIIMAKLMGINAFDQPSVEYGKSVTHNILQDSRLFDNPSLICHHSP